MAKKYFTDESLATLVDETKSYVDSAVSTKADEDHSHDNATTSTAGFMSAADKTKFGYTNIAYGSCSTSAGTAEKVVTVNGNKNWALKAGSLISVYFTYTNTASSPTLNVNSTGAKSIKYNTASASGEHAGYAKRAILYMYDGSSYVFMGWSYAGDTKVTQTSVTTTNKEYPIILGYDDSTTSVTNTVKKASTLTYNPSTQILTAPTFKGALTGNASTATSATKATQDASGNVITTTYETKSDASAKLTEAKSYADTQIATAVDGIMGEGAKEALDTIGELSAALTDNQDMISTLNSAITSKADKADVVQADWDVNDESSMAFVKNRPFYAETINTVIIPENTVTNFVQCGPNVYVSTIPLDGVLPFELEQTYTVVWNGVTYENVCTALDPNSTSGFATLGSVFMDFINGVNAYPFGILIYDNEGMVADIITSDFSESHTVKVTGFVTEICQLDRKYIAEHLDSLPTYAGRNVKGQVFTIDGEEITAENGAEIFNNYSSNIAVGWYSHAEGEITIAKGWYSHAEGYRTEAYGNASHTEGCRTSTSSLSVAESNASIDEGYTAHAEGYGTVASGPRSHAEGNGTTASGVDSHSEGNGTIAAAKAQHAQGKYNVEDAAGTYAHIVGNGSSTSNRKNAHTLDWNGNAWFQGDVYVGGTGQYDTAAKKLMVEPTADDALALLAEVGMIDPIVDANGAVYIEDDNVIYTL